MAQIVAGLVSRFKEILIGFFGCIAPGWGGSGKKLLIGLSRVVDLSKGTQRLLIRLKTELNFGSYLGSMVFSPFFLPRLRVLPADLLKGIIF
jgi:hypothetical protein